VIGPHVVHNDSIDDTLLAVTAALGLYLNVVRDLSVIKSL
jgi:hypothetical protein